MQTLYTNGALSTGGGRDGHVRTDDDRLDLDTRPPVEIGGSGEGTNPEQLFAMGYSACFLGAVHAAGRQFRIDTEHATVHADVSLLKDDDGAFSISVALQARVPAASLEDAQKVVTFAHENICPYSKATRGNVPVSVTVVE